MIKVSIIIPIWKRAKLVRKCLLSILNQSFVEDTEIILINNGGDEKEINLLINYSKEYSNVKIINNKRNKGASYARNQGIKCCKGNYILFLDSDTVLFFEDSILKMYEYLVQHQHCGAIGGEFDGSVDKPDNFFLFFIDSNYLTEDKAIRYSEEKKYEIYEVDYVTTACCMMRKKDLIELKGFDERFFYLAEDKDLGVRLRKLGKKSFISPIFSAFHFQKAKSKNLDYKKSRLYDNFFRLIKERNKFVMYNFNPELRRFLLTKTKRLLQSKKNYYSIIEIFINTFFLFYIFSSQKKFEKIQNSHF